jgi:hypothetical protein
MDGSNLTDMAAAPKQDLIRDKSSAAANARIDRETRGAIEEASGSTAHLRERLEELDREWDIDRALMLNFAIAGGISATMTLFEVARRGRPGFFGALLYTQLGFLAYHALKRWCPPMPVFRRLGFRSAHEIAAERIALHERLSAFRG